MRKRSRYRPKPVMLDPVGYVVAGLQPIAAADKELTTLGIKNHGAIEAVRTGTATRQDISNLVNMLNVATALAHMGQGADWLPELAAASDALKAAALRLKFLFTGLELQAFNTAIEVHDAQMADPATTVQLLERAVAGLKHLERTGKTVRITCPQEPTPPPGYTADELERDNPHNQWMYET